jgi:hypothetical protein
VLKLNNRIALQIIDSYEEYVVNQKVEVRECFAGETLDGEICKTYRGFYDVKLQNGQIAVGIPQKLLQKIP